MRGSPDPAALLDVAVAAARQAAEVLRGHARRRAEGADLGVATKTTATDPVSAADADSERVLVEVLAAARPDDGLLGEEGAARRGTTGLRWVVDPLDGTVNFLYGHPGWAVSVAVERDDGAGGWTGVAGAVLDVSRGELFTGHLGGPAALDGRPIRANDPVDLPLALVATGFGYDRGRRGHQGAVVQRVLASARDVRRVGSAALDLCAVAAGRVDGYYEDTTRRWDWAAGAVVARCAGAVVTPLVVHADAEGVVAAGPHLHPRLDALVRGRADRSSP
jgi:myo-inositol-1(or 4)-monophosphatase